MKVHPTSLNSCHNLIECIENEPMSDWYIGERIVSVIIINNGIKEPNHGYQNCDTSQRLIFVGMSRRENLSVPELKFGSAPF